MLGRGCVENNATPRGLLFLLAARQRERERESRVIILFSATQGKTKIDQWSLFTKLTTLVPFFWEKKKQRYPKGHWRIECGRTNNMYKKEWVMFFFFWAFHCGLLILSKIMSFDWRAIILVWSFSWSLSLIELLATFHIIDQLGNQDRWKETLPSDLMKNL